MIVSSVFDALLAPYRFLLDPRSLAVTGIVLTAAFTLSVRMLGLQKTLRGIARGVKDALSHFTSADFADDVFERGIVEALQRQNASAAMDTLLPTLLFVLVAIGPKHREVRPQERGVLITPEAHPAC